MSSWQVQQQIQNRVNSEPSLANTNVKASVNDSAVILTGVVDNERQHQILLRIAQSYAGDREIFDEIQVERQTYSQKRFGEHHEHQSGGSSLYRYSKWS